MRIEGDLLVTGCIGGYRHKIGDPGAAAEFAATRADSADTSCLLTCPDLAHLDPDPEGICIHFDELTKVDTFIGDVIENGLGLVALKFHIPDFHVQPKIFGNFTGLQHGIMLHLHRLLPFLDVDRFGQTVNFTKFAIHKSGLVPSHLFENEIPNQRNYTDIVTRTCLHGYNIPGFEGQVVDILEIILACIFETDFDNIVWVDGIRNIVKPVVNSQFGTAS